MPDFKPHATYDADSDAIYVYLVDEPVARTRPLDDSRLVDFSEGGGAVGVEFLGVGAGIALSDVPHRPTVERLIGDLHLGVRIFA